MSDELNLSVFAFFNFVREEVLLGFKGLLNLSVVERRSIQHMRVGKTSVSGDRFRLRDRFHFDIISY